MACALDVRSVIVGDTVPDSALQDVRLELASERLTVRELIQRTVQAQIEALSRSANISAAEAQVRLNRQYLTAREIEEQAASGRVGLPRASSVEPAPALDVPAEVEKALRGFTANAFKVLIDGQPVESLEEVIVLTRNSGVTFLRLTPLVGG